MNQPAKSPALDKTFSVRSSEDLLLKLTWEIENLCSVIDSNKGDTKLIGYHAFNGAVTAWSAVEWIIDEFNLTSHIDKFLELCEIQADSETELIKTKATRLKKYITTECVELRICQQIANAMKHRSLTVADNDVVSYQWASNGRYQPKGRPESDAYGLPLVECGSLWEPFDLMLGRAKDHIAALLRVAQAIQPPHPTTDTPSGG